jgi:hypothetical protein
MIPAPILTGFLDAGRTTLLSGAQGLRLFVLTLCAGLLPWCVRAEEGGSGHYAPGAAADFVDALPGTPGFAAVNFFTFYNGGAGATREFQFGGRLALGLEGTVYADTVALLYETPTLPILGGYYAFSVAFPFVGMEIKAQTELTGPGGRVLKHNVRDTASGLGDITFSPFILGWTQLNGDLKYDLRMSIYAPSGSYALDQLANTSLNYWTFEPGFFLSWLSSKIGTEISFFSGFDINTKNNATGYQSGAVFHLDATVAQHLPLLGGFVGIGANVFYYQQISADSGSGAKLGPFEGTTAGIGPVVSYARKIGKIDLAAEVKWLPELNTDNRLKGDYLWFKIGLVF